MRTYLMTLLVVGLACAPAWAQRTGRDAEARRYRTAYREIQNKLQTARVSLDFQDAPLEDVIRFLRSVVGINILLDPEVLKQRDQLKVTLSVKDLKAESALNLVLSFHKLARQYTSGVLLITTRARLNEGIYTVIYDTRDMMFTIRDFPGPNVDITQPTGGSTGGAQFSEPENPTNELSSPDRLLEVIRNNAAKSSWEANPKCSLKMSKGLLVVSQTRSGHYEVRRLLMMLRAAR